MSNDEQPYYEILGVTKDASFDDIRQAYLDLAQAYHIDRQLPHNSILSTKQAKERMKRLNQAYEVLSVPAKRKQYNLRLNCSCQPISSQTDTLFSQAEMSAIATELREEEAVFNRACRSCIQDVEAQYKSYLRNLPEHKPGNESPKRLETKIVNIFIITIYAPIITVVFLFFPAFFTALWLSTWLSYAAFGVLTLYLLCIGASPVVGFLFSLWASITAPNYSRAYCDAVQICTSEKYHRLAQLRQQRELRIAHFKSLAVHLVSPISADFVRGLSARDRFFLQQVIQEKEADDERAQQAKEERIIEPP